MHCIAIEAEGIVANIDHTAEAGLEEGVRGRRNTPGMAFDPQLAAEEVATSNDKSRPYIRSVAMPTRSKVLVDLNGGVWKFVGEGREESVEVVDHYLEPLIICGYHVIIS